MVFFKEKCTVYSPCLSSRAAVDGTVVGGLMRAVSAWEQNQHETSPLMLDGGDPLYSVWTVM